MPRPRRNNLPAPFSPISSLPSNIGPPPSPHSGLSPALSDFSTESADWMDGTNGFTAVKQFTTPCDFCKRNQLVCCASATGKPAKCETCRVSKVKCNFSEPTETRSPLVWCNPTIKAYGYEHPISRAPIDDMDSGVSSKDKPRLMVAVGIPSERIVRAPRTSSGLAGSHESDFSARANLRKHQAALDLAQKEVEDTQEDLRNEVEPATQKRKECMNEVIDLEDKSQVSYSNPVNPPGHLPEFEAGPSSLDRLSPGLGLVPWTFDHPSEDVLEFENDKERARRLLVNTHRLL
ncbi:hypothetical protein PPACK8108_LOCUS9037 [Phakopsora pachyrhizi]|uniref:Zn(2)-C6 fungal-type domain-containing protein n=1 Tax=Phakopsora pachyrhizi TaxID=170000 RepID=A0AAV0AVT6_PHAPC|nr:hypothetical protein PPACK8108_LOCUS9037 [Phakopsora pachyrhizi]